MIARAAAITIALTWWPAVGRAASFDCATAHASIESVICADRALSAADDALAVLYQHMLTLTGPTGQQLIADGQSAWVRFLRVACQTTGLHGEAARCIADQFQNRTRQLGGAVRSMGGVAFAERDSFGVTADQDSSRTVHRYGTLSLSVPQIMGDGGAGYDSAAWNAWITQQAQSLPDAELDGQRDLSISYDLTVVRPELISLVFREDVVGHDAAHPNHTRTAVSWLPAERRGLQPEDVFDPASGWRQAVGTRTALILARRNLRDALHLTPMQLAGRPDRWRLSDDALVILFDPYDVAAYAAGEQDVRLPWRELKPYLASRSALAPLLMQWASR